MADSKTIAIDAMGGDHGPESTIPGAALCLKDHPKLKFMIYGDEARINPLLNKHPDLKKVSIVHHTEKQIRSDEKPSAALRASKGSSMRMAIEAVQEGHADAIVSAGNTGALMALAKMVLKSSADIRRPAIASIFPTLRGRAIMLDLGANVLVDAENLVQFAVLGSVFAKVHFDVAVPTVGLLNVGSEEMKGPDHVRAAAAILSEVDFPGHYSGFVEGDDITKGTVDVIVSDGYAGNIALKTAEGVGSLTGKMFKKYMTSDPLAILGSLLAFFALKRFKNYVDPRRYNGGVFLGLNGLCVKSHGGCDAVAFSSAMKLAANLAEHAYIETVARDINHLMEQEESFLS
ncbi:MAG: phosphate acyltransferase PlsX [Alphaproteobacteria bacterium]|nr:phosphate acyltransferase PlsX [Alphaproteobacteria bacterium]